MSTSLPTCTSSSMGEVKRDAVCRNCVAARSTFCPEYWNAG
jgi:hypothetical protein